MAIGMRLQFLAGCWHQDSVSYHMNLSIGLLKCTHDIADCFCQSKLSKWEQMLSITCLITWFWSHTPPFPWYSIVYAVSPIQYGGKWVAKRVLWDGNHWTATSIFRMSLMLNAPHLKAMKGRELVCVIWQTGTRRNRQTRKDSPHE